MAQYMEYNVFNFEEGLFEENASVRKQTGTGANQTKINYEPKQQVSLGFIRATDSTKFEESTKYLADYLYYTKQYEKAVETYTHCIKYAPKSNKTLKNDAYESTIWCFIKLSKLEQAWKTLKVLIEKMIFNATVIEQQSSALFICAHLYFASGFVSDVFIMSSTLPFNVNFKNEQQEIEFWSTLKTIYSYCITAPKSNSLVRVNQTYVRSNHT